MALVWGAFSNPNAGVSALLGGAICFIPSALFAWRLRSAAKRGVVAFGATFFVGEIVKLALSVVLFAIVLRSFHDVDHAALVVSFIVTLQAYLFALLIA
jgi:ATP synthase protein I